MKLNLRTILTLTEALTYSERLELAAAALHAQFSDDALPPETIASFLKRSFGARETLLVAAEADGKAWGLLLTGPFTDPLFGTTAPLVLVLTVDPSLRHRGVASELVHEAEAILKERGLPTLAARAAHNDDALISMGERWGFVRAWELMVKE
jgi:ribosomal protein S18 acetylase RimI-like enzyme